MNDLLFKILCCPSLYQESDHESDEIDRLVSEGLIYYVYREKEYGWAITIKGSLQVNQKP